MNINWKVRFSNKQFWISFIPAVLLLIQVVAAVFGYKSALKKLESALL